MHAVQTGHPNDEARNLLQVGYIALNELNLAFVGERPYRRNSPVHRTRRRRHIS